MSQDTRSQKIPTEEKRPALYPVEGCGQCAEILAAHLLGAPVYDVMERHLTNHVTTPGKLYGTQP